MNPSQGKKITRNRSGCWACKNRRRRCTEEKPTCAGCTTRGLPCEYGTRLLWEDTAKEAGIAFGRVGMKERFVKKDDTTIEHYLLPSSNKKLVYLNTTYADIYRFCQEYCDSRASPHVATTQEAENHGTHLGPFIPSPWPVCMTGYASQMDSKSRHIFDYYVNVLCHRKVFIDSSENPFRHLVLPLCQYSEELLHAVIAVSANDLRNRHDEVNNHWYEEKLLDHKLKSLRALRAGLDRIPLFPNDIVERDSMLLSILMHCYLEIASGSRYEWTTHLEGARSIIEHHHDREFSSSTLQFATEYFSIRDIFSATATDQQSHVWDVSSNGGGRIRIDIGLSHDLLDIISSITSLARGKYRSRREGTSSYEQESEFLQSAVALQQRLDNLHQWSEEEDDDHLLYWNAAAFKEAAHIYLRHGGFDEAIDSAAIQFYEVNLLTLLHKVHEKQGNSFGTSPYPMWALFIASCAAGEEDRATTLRFFDELNTSWPVSNVPTTMAAVEAIWKMRDFRGGTVEKRQGFEWDEALSRLGWKMSLT